MIFDTHAHYDDKAFDEDRDILLQSLNHYGIKNVVNVAAGMDSCISSLKLADEYEFIYAAVGVHPSETTNLTEDDLDTLEEYCDRDKVVAVGEIGLDYHWEDPSPEHQKEFFIKQLDIARRKQLPVIIHSRDAAADTMDIIRSERAGELGGVIHCYSYSAEQAVTYVDMGFYIGVGGVVTFKNGRKLRECVERIPLERIVLETDCPYLAPEPYRGQRNSSLYLTNVVKEIAQIKQLSIEEVMEITFNNAQRLYRLI